MWFFISMGAGFATWYFNEKIDLNLFSFRQRLPFMRLPIALAFVIGTFIVKGFLIAESYDHPFSYRDVESSNLFLFLLLIFGLFLINLTVLCPVCEESITNKKAAHCSFCGTALHLESLTEESSCGECGKHLKQSDRFCVHCGTENP